jgi:hypothetical protein
MVVYVLHYIKAHGRINHQNGIVHRGYEKSISFLSKTAYLKIGAGATAPALEFTPPHPAYFR